MSMKAPLPCTANIPLICLTKLKGKSGGSEARSVFPGHVIRGKRRVKTIVGLVPRTGKRNCVGPFALHCMLLTLGCRSKGLGEEARYVQVESFLSVTADLNLKHKPQPAPTFCCWV
jgi:hypothetical protein